MMTLLSVLMIVVGFSLIIFAPLSGVGYTDAKAGRTFGWTFILVASGTVLGMMGFMLFAYSL